MNKGHSNILANFFKKTTKNTKDYIPSSIKQENIRESIPIQFPETVDNIYTIDLLPNILFEEWPQDEEEIKSIDFTNNGQKYNDPNSNLIIFPYSLRKETYSSMIWLRPEEYMKQKNLIKLIKEKYKFRNYNYIKNKIDLAQNNLLNFEVHNNDDSNKNDTIYENKEISNDNSNENNLPENTQKSIFSSLENMKTNIKRRNSINIASIEGQDSYLGKEFYNSKLNEEEKQILIENKNIINEFYIVPYEKNNINQQIEKQPIKQQNSYKSNKNHKNSKKNETIEIIQIIYDKLNPSNLNLGIPLCEYCRWVSSQYQILLDNNINTENNENHFLRKIYPQDKNGVPIYNPSGLYWVKLFHMGKYRKIVIDDKFPVHKETFENFLPQCSSPYELWPIILTKALIKLYSYKYKCEPYESDEVGDCSILYSLTRYIGIKLPSYRFLKYLSNLQDIKNKELLNKKYNNNNENDEEKVDVILLNSKDNNNFDNGYDIIVGYISSRSYNEEIPSKFNKRIKNSNASLNMDDNNNNMEQFPLIDRNKNTILYTERTYKIKDLSTNLKNRRKIKSLKKQNLNVPPEYQVLYDKLTKNTVVSTKKELDPYSKFERYFEEHRFLTTENIYQNYQKYITKKTNKIHKSGIICDVGYTLLELFQCGNFNMKRLKPIYFGDMKLDIKVKYKQMTPEEKAIYLDKIKELRKNQKKEKENRINKYLDIGENVLCLKFTNKSLSNDNKKAFEIETLYNLREIEAAKFCIKNNFAFPPVNYFENTFIPKLAKDEETGEINFWTKNFYHKLLKNYFKVKEEEQRLIIEEEKKLENLKKEEEAKKMGVVYVPSYEDNNDDKKLKDHFLLNEFEEKSVTFNDDLNKIIENIIPGTWMRFDRFKECFNNFILFKNMDEFKSQLTIDNIWYNYDKDIYEEKESSRIIHLTKIENSDNSVKNNEINSCLKESELYIIFEPNSEKNRKSVSSELPYEINEDTKKQNKYNDISFSLTIIIYEIDTENKKATELTSYSMKNYFFILNLNLSKISKNPEIKEYFINIQGDLCPFGYHLYYLSNIYNIENYTYNQFLINFKNFIEKKINIIHPILPKSEFYLIKTFILEHKKLDDENESKIAKIMTNFEGYDDNILKNNIEVVLINSITNKKIKIYYKKLFEIDFSSCSKYRVELSIIAPGNIPERSFDYIILYDNPNINIEVLDNIYPFYIRQKYIPNRHHIVFNELIFPSDLITTTLDISLEYRPNDDNNNNNNENNENNNYTDENLPKEVSFPSSIRMNFYFMIGEQLVFQKDFENKSLIRNLILESKPINQKDNNNSNKLILEAYSIKCVLDTEQCPSWLIMPNEYKGDVYWKISVFSTDSIAFIKNTIKEDKEKEVIESWEINEPGRKNKAEKSRKKYFVNIKYNNGEILSPEEEELIPEKFNRKEVIESNSNMLVTNIPPKKGLVPTEDKSDEKKQDEVDILKKLPKIKNYRSLFMKNFYLYSKQGRVITKNKGGIKYNKSYEKCGPLPNINQFCKTKEQREQELKDIEDQFNHYYEEMKKEDEKNESIKENYFTMIQEMNDKFIEERQKILTVSNEEIGVNLNKIITENNNMITKGHEIQTFYEEIKSEDEISDEIVLDWYNNYKILNNEIIKKETNLNNKYKIMIEEIQKILSEKIKNRIEIVLKPETKAKPDLIKKYKDIFNDKIISIELNKETETLLEKNK